MMKPPVTKLKYYARSDIGLVHSCNEDAYAVGGGQSDEHPGSLFVVCDGMGGIGAGEVAAQLAANTIVEAYYASEDRDRGTALIEAFRAANQHVYREVRPAGGTATATAALFVRGDLYIAHVGDSRAYRFHSNSLQQITEDHPLIHILYDEESIRQGLITREKIRKHPTRNKVYRAVGLNESVEIDLFVDKAREDDVVLLCTDGVWSHVEDAEIERTIRENPLKDVVEHLIGQANARGGMDNATAILIWREE